MRAKTIKLIINKTAKKIGKKTIKNESKIENILTTLARNSTFKDFSLLYQTGSAVGGLLIAIFIKDNLSTMDQVETLSNKVDQLSNKITEAFKNQGLIPQEGEIITDVVESVNTSNELEELDQKNQKLKKELTNKSTIIRNQQIGLISLTTLVFVAFLFRPSKALEIIETITKDN
jgi:predicted PurR-regulated permease PerM